MRSYKFAARGERISAIACISTAGLLDVMTTKGTTDGETFYSFVQTHLLPHLLPFNGTNPHSVVIMDNCSVHHTEYYSPDFQPIEETFSKVKGQLEALKDTKENCYFYLVFYQ